MSGPEPCIGRDACQAPVECAAWGFCRERNRAASVADMAAIGQDPVTSITRRRDEAKRRQQGARRQFASPPPCWLSWTVKFRLAEFPRTAAARDVETLTAIVAHDAQVADFAIDRSAIESFIRVVLDGAPEVAANG